MQNNKIEILPATTDDLEEIVEIESRSNLSQWGSEGYQSELEKEENLFFLAKAENKTAGFVFARLITPVVEIFNIAVLPEFRERGIGRKLFEKILERAFLAGCAECWLEVRESNLAARQFYEKLNFRIVGRRKNYYQSPVEDALLLEYKIARKP